MTDDMMFGENNITKPTEFKPVTIDRVIYKSIVREIAEEMFRRSTMQWSYHDLQDIMGDGKDYPKHRRYTDNTMIL